MGRGRRRRASIVLGGSRRTIFLLGSRRRAIFVLGSRRRRMASFQQDGAVDGLPAVDGRDGVLDGPPENENFHTKRHVFNF